MSNEFRGTGNLGAAPVLKHVDVKGVSRPVCELRVFFDEYGRDGNGDLQQTGGFWMTGSLWDRRAEVAAKVLRKGARIRIEGRLREEVWEDKGGGGQKSELRLAVDEVFLALSRIESVQFKERASGAAEEAPE